MTGTKLCDRCWELERRIQADPTLARKILTTMGLPAGIEVLCWHDIATPPAQSGKYIVGHRGHYIIADYLSPRESWHPGTRTGWRCRNFNQTHWADFEKLP